AMKRPISASPLAEIVPTWAISSFEVTFLEFFWRSATMVSALGAKRHAYRVGERIDAVQHFVTRVDREFHFLGGHLSIPFCSSSRGTLLANYNDEDYRAMFSRPSRGPLHGLLQDENLESAIRRPSSWHRPRPAPP